MTFRSGGNLNMLMQALAMTTDELTDGSTLAGIIPDSGATRELWDVFSSTLVDTAGVEIVNTTYPAFGAGDYQNEIQQTMNADPDIVFASMWGGDLISFIQQARGFDFFEEIPEFVASAGSTADVSVSLGEDMVEMIGLDRYFFQFPDTERNQQFVEAYRDEYDSYPLSVSQEAYAGVYGLSAAVEASGETSSDGIVSGLEGLEWEAPEGPKKMRAADHQVIEDKIWCGRIGPVEGLPFYGYSNMRPVDGAEVAGEPNCSF
jgi:branched-chain amino acid transport system substrate-binding protein